MKALLLYTPADAEKNNIYIQSFIKEAKKRAIDLTLVTDIKYISCNVDFVINRSRDADASFFFERYGIKVFNNAATTDICNDKYGTWKYLHNTVQMLETFRAAEHCPIPFPAVIKPRRGHGGEGISLVKNEKEYAAAKKLAESCMDVNLSGHNIRGGAIVQRALKKNSDMRVYVLGKKITACVMRTSKKDFRSNFSLGGSVRLAKPGKDITETVNNIANVFDFGLVGIDFIFDGETPILNEIEDVVGARMLYSLTDINLPGMYLDHILSVL